MKGDIPKDHPRYASLVSREAVIRGFEDNVTAAAGLIAHGRGEAFDYLLGEETKDFAKKSIRAAAAAVLLAEHPVVSVNGNAAALVPEGLAELSSLSGALLEINLFYGSKKRVRAIGRTLKKAGAGEIMGDKSQELH